MPHLSIDSTIAEARAYEEKRKRTLRFSLGRFSLFTVSKWGTTGQRRRTRLADISGSGRDKIHILADNNSMIASYLITGACAHGNKVDIYLMKCFPYFFYALIGQRLYITGDRRFLLGCWSHSDNREEKQQEGAAFRGVTRRSIRSALQSKDRTAHSRNTSFLHACDPGLGGSPSPSQLQLFYTMQRHSFRLSKRLKQLSEDNLQ